MTNARETIPQGPAVRDRVRILLASCLCTLLYGSFFYSLVREQLLWMKQKQAALESIKVLSVPGTAFLDKLGSSAPFYGSLFYLVLLGALFLGFLLLSLVLASKRNRAIFLLTGLLALVALTFGDRVWWRFLAVLLLSFGSFYIMTLPCRIRFTPRAILIFLVVVGCISFSLFYGSKQKFFIKARDRILFDSTLGNEIVSFYYQYSPLAAGLVTPEEGVYQGLVFDKAINDGKAYYLGKGIFATGAPGLQGSADFEISRDKDRLYISNRNGKKVRIDSISPPEIERAVTALFGMNGFLRLNTISLYLFPGAFLILVSMGVQCITSNRKILSFSLGVITVLMISSIWVISLTGNISPGRDESAPEKMSRQGLSLAYFLYQTGKVPDSLIPAVRKMVQSDSQALRYWGVFLLGICGNTEDGPKLISLLEDPVPNIRYTAARSLYRLNSKGSLNYLFPRLITDPSWYVRCKVYSLFLEAGMIPSPA